MGLLVQGELAALFPLVELWSGELVLKMVMNMYFPLLRVYPLSFLFIIKFYIYFFYAVM